MLVNSSELLLNFTIVPLKGYAAALLSARNQKLLASFYEFAEIYIYAYSLEAVDYLQTVTTKDMLADVTWSPRGNIVYTTYKTKKVVVMSEFGKVIQYKLMTKPKCLSVSTDDIIYLADQEAGVYQSTDDGISWCLILNATHNWHCWQAIKVTTDSEHKHDFWTLDVDNKRLRLYSVGKSYRSGNVTWKDINLLSTDGKAIQLVDANLSYDGNSNIFLVDPNNFAVHVATVNGQYHHQLLSSQYIKNLLVKATVDFETSLFFVSELGGKVSVFKLLYGERRSQWMKVTVDGC